jgi:hypothetical protein
MRDWTRFINRSRLQRHLAGLSVTLSFFVAPALVAGTGALFVYLGLHAHRVFYLGCLTLLPLQWFFWVQSRRRRERRFRDYIGKRWLSVEDSQADLDWLGDEYLDWRRDSSTADLIDDRTWNDLEMDAVFSRIDRTFTSIGELSLYTMLRMPERAPESLIERSRGIRFLQHDETARIALQLELHRLGKTRRLHIGDLWHSHFDGQAPLPGLATALACAAGTALVCLALFPGPVSAVMAATTLLTNYVLSSWFRWLVHRQAGTFIHASAAIDAGKRIGKFNLEPILKHTSRVAALADSLSNISKKARMFVRLESTSSELQDLVIDFVRLFFLRDVHDYFALAQLVRIHRAELKEVLGIIGELDALQSAASFRARLGAFCEPSWEGAGIVLDMTNIRHPLLPDPVPNSLALSAKNAFITGSNTSGKSTFLRTAAINAILAQSIHTVCADSYSGSMFRVRSSIENIDDLLDSKSLYQAEAERLLALIKATEDTSPLLCVIDEPLKGTNSPEALCASIEILRYLAKGTVLVLVASHHVDVACELGANYDVFHFPDPLLETNGDQRYLLVSGLDYEHNALTLLGRLGYPPELVHAAIQRHQHAVFVKQ